MLKRCVNTFLKKSRGFTLIELVVVIAIIGILAAIVVPTVSGVTGSAKSGSKESELKNTGDAVSRKEADTSALPITESSEPTTTVSDADGDGTIVVVVDVSGTTNPSDFPSSPDVTCSGASVSEALDACFGSIDFSLLVPDFLKAKPSHADDEITFSLVTGADLTVTGVNTSGDDLELYSDTAVTANDDLNAWNATSSVGTLVLVSDEDW